MKETQSFKKEISNVESKIAAINWKSLKESKSQNIIFYYMQYFLDVWGWGKEEGLFPLPELILTLILFHSVL